MASMTELSGAGIEELVAKINDLEVLVQHLQEENVALKGKVKELSEVCSSIEKENEIKSENEKLRRKFGIRFLNTL